MYEEKALNVPGRPTSRLTIRRLQQADEPKLIALMFGLDDEDRRNRFLGNVCDSSVSEYASTRFDSAAVLHGAFDNDMLCGISEFLPNLNLNIAEGAFVVDHQYRNCGIGTQMALAAVSTARERGFSSLRIAFLRSNFAMRRVAQKIGARLTLSFDEMHGEILP